MLNASITLFRHLLSGDIEGYEAFDPFEIDFRTKANMNDFGYANGCTFFRWVTICLYKKYNVLQLRQSQK